MGVLEYLEIKVFLRHRPWWGQGLGDSDNLWITEPGHELAPPKLKFCIGH